MKTLKMENSKMNLPKKLKLGVVLMGPFTKSKRKAITNVMP